MYLLPSIVPDTRTSRSPTKLYRRWTNEIYFCVCVWENPMLPTLFELLPAFFVVVCWTLANLCCVDIFSQIQGGISGRFSLQEPSSTLSTFPLPFISLQKEMMGEEGAEEGPLLSFHLLRDQLGPQWTRSCA